MSLDDRLRRELADAATPPVDIRAELSHVRRKGARRKLRRRASLTACGLVLATAAVGSFATTRRDADRVRHSVAAEGGPNAEESTPRETWEWTKVAPAPLGPRYDHVAIWTGSEAVIWGGYVSTGPGQETRSNDGAAYNPQTNRWRTIAAAPISLAYRPSAVWTGDEILVWGLDVSERNVGAAYDPANDQWRVIASAPLSPRWASGTVWTGTEMLVWGGATPNPVAAGRAADGAAYNPRTDQWRPLPKAPIGRRSGPVSIWTGTEFVVGGGEAGDGGTYGWAAYRPTTDEWRPLADPPANSSFVNDGFWINGAVMFWNGNAGAALDPENGAWTTIADSAGPGPIVASTFGEVVISWGLAGNKSDLGQLYQPNTDSWSVLPSAGLASRAGHSIIAIGDEVFVWGGFSDAGSLADGVVGRPTATPGPTDAAAGPDEGDGGRQLGGEVEVSGDPRGNGDWRLVVRHHTKGDCVEIVQGTNRSGGCGPGVPEAQAISASVSGVDGAQFVFGAVRRDAPLVRLVRSNGSTQLMVPQDPGSDYPFLVFVFDPTLTEGAIRVEIVDTGGAVLHSAELGSEPTAARNRESRGR